MKRIKGKDNEVIPNRAYQLLTVLKEKTHMQPQLRATYDGGWRAFLGPMNAGGDTISMALLALYEVAGIPVPEAPEVVDVLN